MHDRLAPHRAELSAIGARFHYDVTYLERRIDAAPGACLTFTTAPSPGHRRAVPAPEPQAVPRSCASVDGRIAEVLARRNRDTRTRPVDALFGRS